jgi:ferritin-like metal-binding protein YciE
MAIKTLKDGLVNELRDMLSAENQIVKALPKMIKNTGSDELRQALQDHLDETREQAERVKGALNILGGSERAKACAGMKGIIEEGDEIMKDASDDTLDALIIAAAQKVEHYEIASYGTAIAWAELLGETDVVNLLTESLNEEKAADEKLTEIARSANVEATEAA